MPALPPLHQFDPRSILFIKPSALGDIVHALPVLSALRRRFPRARITWVVNRAYEPLLIGHPDLDATLPFDRAAARTGLLAAAGAFSSFFFALRQGQFDLAIDLQGLFRSGLIAWASGASRRVALAGAREGARCFYTDVVELPGPKPHAVDRYWRMAEALGAGEMPKGFCLTIAPKSVAWATQILRAFPRPWLMLGPGSRWLTKRWLPEHFAELANRSRAEFGGTTILVGGTDEIDLSAAVRSRLQGPCLDLTGRTPLAHLVAILDRADVMVANDTGPLHLAVALGRPVVAPYTCTKVAWTGPYGMANRAIETSVSCAGSCRRRCSHMKCMNELTPDRLWPALREVLQSCLSHTRSA